MYYLLPPAAQSQNTNLSYPNLDLTSSLHQLDFQLGTLVPFGPRWRKKIVPGEGAHSLLLSTCAKQYNRREHDIIRLGCFLFYFFNSTCYIEGHTYKFDRVSRYRGSARHLNEDN